MGDRPIVSGTSNQVIASENGVVLCDQAVFTSVRSPMGEGYRLVGASVGVLPEEKVEITRRSPSHGALCIEEGCDAGLVSYSLASGRRCIGYCCHAGTEHTGRGGQRVYTHMALLDRTNFALFDSDATSVHAALAAVVHREGPMLHPVSRMDPVALTLPGLPIDEDGSVTWPAGFADSSDYLWPVAGEMLAGRRLILIGLSNPLCFLKWTLLSLPRSVREGVDVSSNITFSPTRRLHLVLLPSDESQIKRLIIGQPIKLWSVDDQLPAFDGDFGPWLHLLKKWWSEGRIGDVIALVGQVPSRSPASCLNRMAEKQAELETDCRQGSAIVGDTDAVG